MVIIGVSNKSCSSSSVGRALDFWSMMVWVLSSVKAKKNFLLLFCPKLMLSNANWTFEFSLVQKSLNWTYDKRILVNFGTFSRIGFQDFFFFVVFVFFLCFLLVVLLFVFFFCFLLFFCCFLLFLFLAGKVSKVKDLTEQILCKFLRDFTCNA